MVTSSLLTVDLFDGLLVLLKNRMSSFGWNHVKQKQKRQKTAL